jgi:hypothetical protein
MYQISFYVPENAAEKVKLAMFAAGAGQIGHYDRCSWQVLGQGQFRPLAGSQPALGSQDQLETVVEYKVEMVCREDALGAAIAAMKLAHPYEEVAYQVLALAND